MHNCYFCVFSSNYSEMNGCLYLFCGLQYEKVLKFISTAKSEGATILCGGSRPEVKLMDIF